MHHIGDVGPCEQGEVGIDVECVAAGARRGVNVGKSLAKQVAEAALLAVHELHVATTRGKVDDRAGDVLHVESTVEQHRLVVEAHQAIVVEAYHIIIHIDGR